MMKRTPDMISTLVDSELNDWELKTAIQALEQDKSLQSCWRNYQLIGDAMRSNLPKHLCLDLSDRVSRAMEHEPIYFKPQINTSTSVPSSSHSLSRTKTAIGFALAASLSAIAIVGVLGFEQKQKMEGTQVASSQALELQTVEPERTVAAVLPNTDNSGNGGLIASKREQPRFPGAMPARPMVASATNHAPPKVRPVQGAMMIAKSLPTEGDLYDYLMNYHQYAAQNDNEDALSYLRVVSYASSQ